MLDQLNHSFVQKDELILDIIRFKFILSDLPESISLDHLLHGNILCICESSESHAFEAAQHDRLSLVGCW